MKRQKSNDATVEPTVLRINGMDRPGQTGNTMVPLYAAPEQLPATTQDAPAVIQGMMASQTAVVQHVVNASGRQSMRLQIEDEIEIVEEP